MSIAKIIVVKRKELGLTQHELARKLDVTERSVARWEKGVSSPDIHSLKRLSQLFNISMDTFYDEISVEPIIAEPIDPLIINRFVALSVLSSGILLVSFVLILVSYFMPHRSDSSIIYQVIGLITLIISITIFITSYATFSTNYKTKKLQKEYRRIKIIHLIVFCSLFASWLVFLLIIL